MANNEPPPYDDKYIWRTFSIATLFLLLHFSVYEITVSDDEIFKRIIEQILSFARPFVPGAGGYQMPHMPYEIPHMQLILAATVTFPLALLLLRPLVKEDLDRSMKLARRRKKKQSLEHAVFDLQVLLVIGMLVIALVLFIPPSSIFIGAAKSSFFGFLAPIKYAGGSYAMGHQVMMFRLSLRIRSR